MSCVAAKFVPCLLNEDQKQNRMQISEELLARVKTDTHFLKHTITGDETWIYGYDIKTERQSSQWKWSSSLRLRREWQVKSNMKSCSSHFVIPIGLFTTNECHKAKQAVGTFIWRV
jgi:hypothetical protein